MRRKTITAASYSRGHQRRVELVGEGEVDLALVALESELGDLETTGLFKDPFVVAMPPDHPLARRKRLRAADLHGAEVLLLADGHCLREQTSVICDAAGACELGDFRATSLGTLIQMVEHGVGLTLLPLMATGGRRLDGSHLAVPPFVRPEPSRTVALAWRRSSPHRASFETLSVLLRSAGVVGSAGVLRAAAPPSAAVAI